MELIHSIRPLAAVLVSLFVIPILISCGERRPNFREAWTFVAGIIKFSIIVSMVPGVLKGAKYYFCLVKLGQGVSISFKVDGLGLTFALVASFLWIVTSLYSIGYMRGLKEHSQTRFFCFFALALSSTIGVAFSANLLTMYMFYEILSLSTYPLVVHHQDEDAKISGRKYLTYIITTSVGLVLPAMIICYIHAHTLTFQSNGILMGKGSDLLLTILFFMFLFGFAKAAIMPLHSWLPAAMVAPTPVSALLHAVAVVKVGVFSIIRIFTGIYGIELIKNLHLGVYSAYIAVFTILVGSLIAMSQDELKRRLAFSTISQLSYIILGISLLTPRGMLGGIIHIVMHAFGKITLFFGAGAIYVATGKKYISQLNGLGKKMPITFLTFFIGALSVIGLPPTGGFYSKWYLVLGCIDAHNLLLLLVLLISSFLNAVYFLPIVFKGFFYNANDSEEIKEAPICCIIPMIITALISIILFFYQDIFYKLLSIGLK
ncbi:monovalent cation/H+ antiporter subunit D family protein [Desulfothermus naphthae]